MVIMLRIPKIINIICNSSNLRLLRNGNEISQCMQSNFVKCKISFGLNYSTDLDADNETKPKRKTQRIAKITLVNLDNSITVTLLEEAHRIAKRRKLELVHVLENSFKNGREVYKLVNPTEQIQSRGEDEIKEYHKDGRKRKTTKLFVLKHKIDERDLIIKINNINRSLKKGHKVKIIHTNPDEKNDNILQGIKRKVEGTLLTEKLQKGSAMLTYSSLLEDHDNDNNESEKDKC